MPMLVKLTDEQKAAARKALASVVHGESFCVSLYGVESDGFEVDRHHFTDQLEAVSVAEEYVERGFGSSVVWNGANVVASFG